MRVAIISDIHANIVALKAVLNRTAMAIEASELPNQLHPDRIAFGVILPLIFAVLLQ